MKEIIVIKTAKETERFAYRFSRRILKIKPAERALVIGLVGDLGSGKTVFTKGFAKGLGIKENIVSPTFVLEKVYELARTGLAQLVQGRSLHRHFIHIDAYRIEKSKELIDLGFKNLIRDPKNIILIEWADRISKILPKDCIKIYFEHAGRNKRRITI